MARSRRRTEWRETPGTSYELRQYAAGRPTGRVAVPAWEAGRRSVAHTVLAGPDVWLLREQARLVLTERPGTDAGSVSMQIPFRSCLEAVLENEPGLVGNEFVRLSLTIRIGHGSPFVLPLWFPVRARPLLDDLVRTIVNTHARRPPRPGHRRLEQADDPPPDIDEWIVFRPAEQPEPPSPEKNGTSTGKDS